MLGPFGEVGVHVPEYFSSRTHFAKIEDKKKLLRKNKSKNFTAGVFFLAWLCPQLSSNNKCGMHLADVCAIFKYDYNIICTVGFHQPVISAR